MVVFAFQHMLTKLVDAVAEIVVLGQAIIDNNAVCCDQDPRKLLIHGV